MPTKKRAARETMPQFQERIEAELAAIKRLAIASRADEEQATGAVARSYSKVISRCDAVLAELRHMTACNTRKGEKTWRQMKTSSGN